jgi:hypothetical protein
MTKDQLLKKDWQLLTAQGIIDLQSSLLLVIDNQTRILSKLYDIPLKAMSKEQEEKLSQYKKEVTNAVRKNIPDYPQK